MELFRMFDLFIFLSNQRKKGYSDINVLVELFESNKLKGLRKKYTLLSGMHNLELFEIGHPNANFRSDKVDGETVDIDQIMHQKIQSAQVPYQIFDCEIRNGVARFDAIMN